MKFWSAFKLLPRACYCDSPHLHEFTMRRQVPCGKWQYLHMADCCKCKGLRMQYGGGCTIARVPDLTGWDRVRKFDG